MTDYIITTDSSSDAGKETLEKLNVPFISYKFHDGENEYVDEMSEEQNIAYIEKMKTGSVFKTAALNVEEYKQFFRKQTNKNIIHVSLCEGLSSSINNARLASIELKQEGYNISIIDATIASLGSYLIVLEAIKNKEKGLSMEDNANDLFEKAKTINTYYTTNNLTYFARGGRLSVTAAFICKTLNINVILACRKGGELYVKTKTFGRKSAFKKIIALVKETVINPENETCYICHAQNEQGAKDLIEAIKKEVNFKDYEIHTMGPTIGAHAGPGLLACFYFGKQK